MNRIYSLVFNRALGQLQAVSEFASRRTGGATGRAGLSAPARLARCGLAVALLIATAQAWAQDHTLPGTHTILGNSGGALGIDRTTPGVLEITQNGRTIIQWDSFNIGADALVNFTQDGAGSVALNYVPDGGVSNILGDLTANAGVYLINPNGVLFGAGAEVSVGNLLVSSMSPQANWDETPWQQHFVATGGLTLAEQTQSVISNRGSITATDGIVLAGNAVFNDTGGRIEVGNGDLSILSARGVEVTVRDGRFSTLLEQNVTQIAPGAAHMVHNLGRLSADNITLAARMQDRIVGTAVNVSGVVEANSLDIQSWGGALTLAGEISVGSLAAETRQTVPHTTVYDIYQPIEASALTVSGEASFDSSGNVHLYGASNRLLGPVALSGIEAFIDTVDNLVLEAFSLGSLSVRGVAGLMFRGGTLTGFLDVDREGEITQTGALTVQGTTFLDSGLFSTALNHGNNDFGGVVDAYGAGISLQDRNDLTLNRIGDLGGSAVTLTAAGTLTLPAHAIDTGNSALTLSSGGLLATAGALSGGAVSLHGGTGVAIHHAVAGSAGIDLSSGGAIVQSLGGGLTTPVLGITGTSAILDAGGNAVGALGDVDLEQHFELRNDGAIVQQAGTAVVVGGTTTLAAGSGAVVLDNENNDFVGTVDAFGNGIALRSRNDLSIGTLVNAADGALSLTAGSDLTLPGGAIDTGSGALTLRAGNRLSNLGALRGSAVDVYGGAGLELAHDIAADTRLRLGSGGNITQSGGTLLAQSLEVDASGAAALTQAGNRIDALGDIVTGGRFALRNDGAIGQLAGTVLDVGGDLDLDAGSAAISIANAGNRVGGDATLRGGTISARTAGDLRVASVDAGADQAVSLVAGGALVLGSGVAIDTGSAALTLASDGGMLTSAGPLAGGEVRLRGRDGIVLGGDLRAGAALDLRSAGGSIRQTGGAITALGTTDAVAAGDVALAGAGNTFADLVTLSGADLRIRDAGTLRLDAVDGSALQATAAQIELNRSIATTGDQAYTGAVRLMADLTLQSTGGGIAFGAGVEGTQALIVDAAGAVGFGGPVGATARLISLEAGGTSVALGGSVFTTGAQRYDGAVTLGADLTLASSAGGIAFGAGIEGAHALTLDARAGEVALAGDVGAERALAALAIDAAGIELGGDVRTEGDQRYGGATVLTGNVALDSTQGGIAFESTVDGVHALDVVARSGAVAFDGAVGGSDRLTALTVDAGTLSLASDVAVSGGLSLTTDDADIVAPGRFLVGGVTTLDTGTGRVQLLHADNDFSGRVDVRAGDVAIADANALAFGTVHGASLDATARGNLVFGTTTLTGALTASSTEGFIQHSGAADIGGATTLTARHDITADNIDNAFAGTVALRGANARIIGRDALRFGAVDVSTLQAIAPELWLGADMNSTGFQLYAGDVHLAQDTRIASVVGDIDIRGTVDGSSALDIAAGGRVFLRQAVGGTTALTALEVGSGVTDNIFLGGDVATVGDQTYRTRVLLEGDAALESATGDITFGDTVNGAYGLGASARAGAVTFAGAVGAGEALRALDVDALTFSGQGIRVTGDLDIRIAQGDLVQGGLYDVGGDATFATGGGRIGLDGQPNAFAGAVGLTGGAAAIANTRGLRFGAVDVSSLTASATGGIAFDGPLRTTGDLRTISSGDVTQRGALTVGGQAEFDALGRAITLDHEGNAFGQPVGARGGAVTLAAADDLRLGQVSAQTLDAIAHGGDLQFAGPLVVRGTLDARAVGAIGQSGTMRVEGAARFETGGGAITLDGQSNEFLGLVHLDGGAATVHNQGELALGTVNTASLDATAQRIALGAGTVVTEGDQTYRSAVDLVGTTRLTSQGGDIAFASTVDGAHALQATAAGTVAFGDAVGGVEALDALTVTGGRFDAATGITVDGDLAIAAAQGGIVQRGAYRVGGDARFDANAASLDLGRADNAFAGEVHLAGGAVGVRNAGDLRLGDVRARTLTAHADGGLTFGRVVQVADSLTASAVGDIGQSAALVVGGPSVLTAAGRTIALEHRDNDFSGPVSVSAAAVRLRDRRALSLGMVSATNMTVTAGTQLSFDGSTQIGGRLEASAGAGIAQTHALHVGGVATFDAGDGAIALAHAGNDFAGPVHLAGGAVTIRDRAALQLGRVDAQTLTATAGGALEFGEATEVAGALVATSGGDIGQAGALRVGGGATFAAGGQAIVLDHAGNAFAGPVHLAARTATLHGRDALVLGGVAVDEALAVRTGGGLSFAGATTVGGALSASADGRIDQTGALQVGGRADIDAGSGDIALTAADNAFGGPVRLAGGAVALQAAGDLTVAGLVAARGRDVALTAGGDLVLPEAAIDIGGGAMSLSSGGRLSTRAALRGGDVALRGAAIALGHDVTARGTLSLDSAGDIAQGGGRLSAARMTGRAGGDARFGGDNRIDALDGFRARALDLHNATALRVTGPVEVTDGLLLSTARGDLTLDGGLSARDVRLEIGGGISQSAAGRIQAGTLSGRATGPVRLGGAGGFVDNRVATLGDFVAHDGFSLTNGQTLTLSSLNGSAFTVDAGTAAFYLSVDGGVLQQGTEWLYNGGGTWAATGGIGDPDAPIYVTALRAQTVASIGRPPAYFHAIRPDGSLLPIDGAPSVNVPTAIWAARAQSANQRVVGYVDVGADASNYRAYGVVEPGIRLPEDQQPECDPDFPEPDCVATQ